MSVLARYAKPPKGEPYRFLRTRQRDRDRLLHCGLTGLARLNPADYYSDLMSTLPLSEVKARLSEIADEVNRTHERVHVTRNGREYVVLVSAQDLDSLEATIELLSDPTAVQRVRDAEAAIAAGDLTGTDEMARLMGDRRQREHREREDS